MMNRFLPLCILLLPLAADAGEKRRLMQVDDLLRVRRVADPQISPDGRWVVYAVGVPDLEKNRVLYHLWLAPTDASSPPRRLTAADKSDRHPRWSPDGKTILFESTRSGSSQLWAIDLAGGEARQLTSLSTGSSTGIWSRDGKQIAFVSPVWPEFSEKPFKESDRLNKERIDEREKSPVKAKVFTRLFFRHWDDYVDDKRQHLFVAPYVNGEAGEPRDVTPGDRDAYPTSTTFSVGDDFTFSPDGTHLVFTAVPAKDEAWSTNYDLCRVPVDNRSTEWETLTRDNPAADDAPQFSPDGRKLAYRAQKRPGFEADRWELMLVDCDPGGKPAGTPRTLTPTFEHWVDTFVWAGDSTLFLTAEARAAVPLWRLQTDGTITKHFGGGAVGSPSVSRAGDRLAFTRAAMDQPPVVCTLGTAREAKDTLHTFDPNAALLKELDLPRPESVTVPVEGAEMQMWILKPPGFDPRKKWPVVYLVHGGPQGAWDDSWSYRWNPQAWAAQGYVVAMPNPRGSTGFGQKFVDAISGDWGGKVYDDLMKGADYVEKLPYVDKARVAAAGASFGGYMMNWFAVNTGRFKCLINHCGVWNFDSMYATTEELWFDEWEHGGPPWGKDRHSYEKHSPHRYAANLAKYRTPMLIIHNDLDFRVPVSEGIQVFTTLQRLGVPSRFINFPDEGHWVLKPRNSQYWHKEVFAWLKKYNPPGGR